jgi:hypothetical protein
MVRDRKEWRRVVLEGKVHDGQQCFRRGRRRRIGRRKGGWG